MIPGGIGRVMPEVIITAGPCRMSCCDTHLERWEATETDKTGVCGFCGSRDFVIVRACAECKTEHPYRDVVRFVRGDWLCRDCHITHMHRDYLAAEELLLSLCARSYTLAPRHVADELGSRLRRLSTQVRGTKEILESARRGYRRREVA